MAGKKCTAKRKYEEEHRTYLTEWESLHFFVERNGKPFCLICQVSLAQFKASNLQRHLSSLHANFDQEFRKGTELPKHKLIALKRQAEKQTQMFQKSTMHSLKHLKSLHLFTDAVCLMRCVVYGPHLSKTNVFSLCL
jgi:hypothetical protein